MFLDIKLTRREQAWIFLKVSTPRIHTDQLYNLATSVIQMIWTHTEWKVNEN